MVPVERCVVVPYGVDTRFSPASRGGRPDRLRVLSVGEAGLRKGVDLRAGGRKVARSRGAISMGGRCVT